MTGIEKILKHIEDDAASAANTLITEAKSRAGSIIADAKAEGERKSAEIMQKSKQDVNSCLKRAESAAYLKERRIVLEAKQEMIDGIIMRAKATVEELPDKEYFDLIEKMISKYALCQAGRIMFSQKDRKRMPVQFEAAMKKALLDKKGAELVISEETTDIDGGFVLIYGDVEENCSFEALFLAAKESLQDKVSSFLFD